MVTFISEIHKDIRKALRLIINFKYPKLITFILMIILAYFLFRNPDVNSFVSNLDNMKYLGMFIAGLLFSFGFTTPFAAGFFITLSPESIWIPGIIGGIGALIGDMVIFKFVRFSLMNEFKRLKRTKILNDITSIIDWTFGKKLTLYLLYAFAGFVLASPLPDELGVLMLAGVTKIKTINIAIISIIANTIGILILLGI